MELTTPDPTIQIHWKRSSEDTVVGTGHTRPDHPDSSEDPVVEGLSSKNTACGRIRTETTTPSPIPTHGTDNFDVPPVPFENQLQ